jgi:hypothetical protein
MSNEQLKIENEQLKMKRQNERGKGMERRIILRIDLW